MSQINKLAYVDNKLGATSQGQQTTRIIFSTIIAPGNTNGLSFFTSFQGLTNGQTNLAQNRLDSSESMIIKSIWLAQFEGENLVDFGGAQPSTLSVLVGNQQVVKDLPIQFNQGVSGQAFDRLHTDGGVSYLPAPPAGFNTQSVQPCEIRLLTDIVIPPQVSFEVRIQGNNVNYGSGAVVCALSGYGKIFSAGNTF